MGIIIKLYLIFI